MIIHHKGESWETSSNAKRTSRNISLKTQIWRNRNKVEDEKLRNKLNSMRRIRISDFEEDMYSTTTVRQ